MAIQKGVAECLGPRSQPQPQCRVTWGDSCAVLVCVLCRCDAMRCALFLLVGKSWLTRTDNRETETGTARDQETCNGRGKEQQYCRQAEGEGLCWRS